MASPLARHVKPMSHDGLKSIPLRHHLLFAGLIVGLVTLIGVFFTRYPMDCQIGYTLASGSGSTVCVKSGSGK